MLLGAALLLASIGFLFHNIQQDSRAAVASDKALPQVVEAIKDRQTEDLEEEDQTISMTIPVANLSSDLVKDMPTAEIDGHDYIGFLSFPSVEAQWPVMADWSYSKLELAPCRYSGNLYADNMVIMGHNYRRHFRKLKKLVVGDTVYFTDMDGQCFTYEVMAVDILGSNDVEDMIAGEFDLTLFTCTYGGESRYTVRCDRVKE